jgi:hypothetical protein
MRHIRSLHLKVFKKTKNKNAIKNNKKIRKETYKSR